MKLNASFEQLQIEAAKMHGLEALLLVLKQTKNYADGLSIAVTYTKDNGGYVCVEDSVTHLSLHGFSASCFQPYPDIDRLYWEC